MTRTTDPVDAARLALLLGELRLPAIKAGWKHVADRADKEGWPAARFLATLAEHEVAERVKRRIERHLVEARLPPGKTLESFDFNAVPMISKAQVMALAAIDRLVHHATIFEMNVESYRRKAALSNKRGRERPPKHATAKSVADNDQDIDVAERQSTKQKA
jgi:DNA replication protein DnaC